MKKKPDWKFINFLAFCLGMSWFFLSQTWAKESCDLKLTDKSVARVDISPRGCVLSFPTKPSKVSLGRSGSFGIEYVEDDLIISPLSTLSRSNLFVYLDGRRFTFDLNYTASETCAVISISDAQETRVKVNFNER